MLGDDQEGHDELNGDEEPGPISADQHHGKNWVADRANDGSQRDIAAERQNDSKDGDGRQGRPGSGDEEYAESRGHALSPLEAQPDGKHMAKDSAESSEGLHIADRGGRGEQSAEEGSQVDGGAALEHIEQEGEGTQALSAGAEDIGGAYVSAADGPNVLMAEKADEQVAGGDGAEQIGGGRDNEACKGHNERV